MNIKPEYKKKSIRSYVIRAGRMTDAQKKAFDTWWPEYGLSLERGMIDPSIVFSRAAPLVVEIGFGMGDSLLQMATAEPEKNFIGIEVHPPGVGHLINRAGLERLTNLKVYMADALDVLDDCIPDDSVSRLQLYFPDPWHKKKHNKRRIVQLDFVQKVRQKLQKNSVFHLATDWGEYAEDMMQKLSLAAGFDNVSGEYLFSARPEYRPKTKFEGRGERLGHSVWDLLFTKTS